MVDFMRKNGRHTSLILSSTLIFGCRRINMAVRILHRITASCAGYTSSSYPEYLPQQTILWLIRWHLHYTRLSINLTRGTNSDVKSIGFCVYYPQILTGVAQTLSFVTCYSQKPPVCCVRRHEPTKIAVCAGVDPTRSGHSA